MKIFPVLKVFISSKNLSFICYARLCAGYFYIKSSPKENFPIKNKADKSASNSLNPSIFEGLVTLCAPDAVCFSRHIPHASGRILAERFLFDRKFIVISYQTKKLSPEYHKHHCHIAYDSSRTALYLQLSVQKRPHHYCCS